MSSTHVNTLYQPLNGDNAVRFIKLLPGHPSEQISLRLVCDTIATAHPPIYEATSYTWGNANPTSTILCNGLRFQLRQNAHGFLHRLRRPDQTRLLWMDCICINQDDLQERAQQVKIMHLIYQLAEKVLIWLGPEDRFSPTAMHYIAQVDSKPPLKEMQYVSYGADFKDKSFLFDSMVETAKNKKIMLALTKLLCRPWFRRVWIQQEAALGIDTRVICGPDDVSWDQLISIVWLLMPRQSTGWPPWTDCDFQAVEPSLLAARIIQSNRMSHFRIPNPWNPLLDKAPHGMHEELLTDVERRMLADKSDRGSFSVPFVKLARDCSWCQASDPSDKVYALYNLDRRTNVGSSLSKRPQVDYTIPWQVVFIRNAKWMYDCNPVEAFHMAGRCQQDGVNVPSWVPDLRCSIDNLIVPHLSWAAGGLAYSPHFRFLSLPRSPPSSNPVPTYSYKDDKNRMKRIPNEGLELTAILQDRIAYASTKVYLTSDRLRNNITQFLQKIDADLLHIKTHLPKYFTGESGPDAFAATIITNTTHEDKLASTSYERLGLAEWQAWLANGFPDADQPSYHEAVENAEYFAPKVFSISTHGIMCLAPATTQRGDYIALLQGLRYPVALRKVGQVQQQYFELIGPCYVHRLMRGRAWNLIDEFKCKYRPGSEDEDGDAGADDDLGSGVCRDFPFNARSDYRRIVRVLGKRRIILV